MIDQVAFSSTDKDGVTATVRFTVTSYNKPVTVEKPTGTKSLLDALGQLFGGSGAGAGGTTANPLEMFSGFSL